MSFEDILLNIKKDNYYYAKCRYNCLIGYDEDHKCYVWCFPNGKIVKDESDMFGIKRVILTPDLFKQYWRLVHKEELKDERTKYEG